MLTSFLRFVGLYALLSVIPDVNTVWQKWQQDTSAAAQRYGDGVAQTTKDPTALAIAAGPRYLQGVQNAFNSGRWANALRAVGQQGWKAAVAAKGVQNFQTGVNSAQAKFTAAFTPLLAYEATLQQQVDAMPSLTDTDRENRALAWIRGMRQYAGR